jgi:hypothetical protein
MRAPGRRPGRSGPGWRRQPGGEAVDQQALQERADPEVGQRLGVHADAAQPLIGDVLVAQAGHRTGAADALDRREQPQSHQDARVRRRMAGLPLHRLDRSLEPRQVQPLDKPPDQANTVIGRHEILEADRPKLHLTTLRHPQPAAAPFRRHQFRQTFEQFRFATRGHRQTSKQDTTITILAAEIRSDTRKFASHQKIFRL